MKKISEIKEQHIGTDHLSCRGWVCLCSWDRFFFTNFKTRQMKESKVNNRIS